MKFCEWCHLAQNEQIVDEKTTLYANLGHTRHQDLINRTGLKSFCESIDVVDPSRLHCPPDQDYGKANLAINSAISEAYNPSSAFVGDFRLAGKVVDTDEVLINVLYGPYRPRKVRPSGGTPNIIWLTQFSKVKDHLEDVRLRMI